MTTNVLNPLSDQQQPSTLFRSRPRRGRSYFPPGRSRILASRDEVERIPSRRDNYSRRVHRIPAWLLDPQDDEVPDDIADQETTREQGSPDTENFVVCSGKNLAKRDPDLKRKREDDQNEICVICQDELNQESTKIAVLECKHEYHDKCIEIWLGNKNLCPICRKSVVL